MGLLSNRIARSSLKPGDHIYSWRTAYVYAHHGIYVGDDRVIHFTRGQGEEVGTGTVLDDLLVSSIPKHPSTPCPNCDTTPQTNTHGVISSCLDCFLAGGALYRFEYSVNTALFIARMRGGTCTRYPSDPDQIVLHRAFTLLAKGFRVYNVFRNNCEDFAIYCKTGFLGNEKAVLGQSGQAASIIEGLCTVVSSLYAKLVNRNVYGMVVTEVVGYCANRYMTDIGNRRDIVEIEVEDLTAGLASGRVKVVKQK